MPHPSDLKQKLDALRRQQSKQQTDTAAPLDPSQKEVEEGEEQPPVDIRAAGLSAEDVDRFMRLTAKYALYSSEESAAKRKKGEVGGELKELANWYGLHRVIADTVPVTFYVMNRSKIDKALLLAKKVSAAVIADCTVTTSTMAVRVGRMKEED